jgi:cardiolipin synthase
MWRGNVLTWPNAITFVRLSLLPVYVVLLSDERIVAASFFLGFLAATDWVDGYVARRFSQISEFGKVLDPVADRAVFFVGIGAAMYFNYFPAWFGTLILIREISIALLMVGATILGMDRFPVSRIGKWATFALMSAVPWITIGQAGGWWVSFTVLGWLVGVPGVLISYWSFFGYLPTVKSHMSSRSRY